MDVQEVRGKLQQHQGLATAVMGVVLLGVAGFIAMRIWSMLNPPPPPEDIVMGYFYDQATKELYEMPADTPAPMERPSGPFEGEPAGVKAHVFACGQCADKSNRFVGFLEKPLPEADRPGADDPRSEVFLMKRPDDAKWVESDSPQASAIMREVRQRCAGGQRANFCRPEAKPE